MCDNADVLTLTSDVQTSDLHSLQIYNYFIFTFTIVYH